jgi:3'-phosphoadenosine 5'-phosphosulfate sulfotransferase (PAPS reductase)/FAD synthetase
MVNSSEEIQFAISASYGNDSIAMIQWAAERCLDPRRVAVVYCNTGWAADDWPDRVVKGEDLARRLGFRVVQLQSMGMEDLVRMKMGFPAHGQQFCTAWLKGLPFLQWIDEVDPQRKTVVMIGKRRAESEDRKSIPEWIEKSEYHGDRRVWHPLYLHTEANRDALLMKAGVEKLTHRSDECSPCVNANRNDLRRLRISRIKKTLALELEVKQPMFRAAKHGGAQGIQQVIHWAKYSPGQFVPGMDDLFDAGCGSPFGCGL